MNRLLDNLRLISKQKAQTWLDLWISVIETEDIEMFSNIFTHDLDMVNIGTDDDEW